jgi:hypothetical protein
LLREWAQMLDTFERALRCAELERG